MAVQMIAKAQSARGWQHVVRMYICVCPLPITFSWLRDRTAVCLTPWCGSAQLLPWNFSAVIGVMSCFLAVPEVGKVHHLSWVSLGLCLTTPLSVSRLNCSKNLTLFFNEPFKNNSPLHSDKKDFQISHAIMCFGPT